MNEVARLKGHEDWVLSVAVSHDGKHVLSCDDSGAVMLWAVNSQQIIAQDQFYKSVYSVAFSPDGRLAVAAGVSGRYGGDDVRVYSVPDLRVLHQHRTEDLMGNMPFSARFLSNANYVVIGRKRGPLAIWSTADDNFTGVRIDCEDIFGISVFGHDMALVGGTQYAQKTATPVCIVNLRSGEVLIRFPGPNEGTVGVAAALDGSIGVIACGDKSFRLLDLRAGREMACAVLQNQIKSVALSPNAKLAVVGDNVGNIRLWSTTPWMDIAECRPGPSVLSLAFFPDGKHVLSTGSDGCLRVLSISAS